VDATVAAVVAAHVPVLPVMTGTTAGTCCAGNDPRLPALNEKAAMAGTSGVTGNANRFVTDGDSRLSNARAPTPHTHAAADVTGTAVLDADARLSNARAPTSLLSSGPSGPGAVGYSTGAGGSVTQATSKSTGVTLNTLCGKITMNGAALAAGAEVSFVVTNSQVASTDVVVVCVQSVGTAGSYLVSVGAVSNGSFAVTVSNASAGSLSQAVVLNFAVIKAVSA
jgi:hypothetical protein